MPTPPTPTTSATSTSPRSSCQSRQAAKSGAPWWRALALRCPPSLSSPASHRSSGPGPHSRDPEPRRCHIAVVRTTTESSLKERAGVKRGLACGFAVAAGFAGHDGMASRLLCPGWCPLVRAGRRVRDRAEPGRRGGAAGVLDAQAGEPDHGRPGGKPQARERSYAVMGAPSCRCAAWQARWLPSSLRDARPGCDARPGWPGPHGAVRVRSGRGSITSSSAPPRWRGTHFVAAARPAGPAAGHAAGGCPAERACPSRRA